VRAVAVVAQPGSLKPPDLAVTVRIARFVSDDVALAAAAPRSDPSSPHLPHIARARADADDQRG
jgi:hypothetical protein